MNADPYIIANVTTFAFVLCIIFILLYAITRDSCVRTISCLFVLITAVSTICGIAWLIQLSAVAMLGR